MSGTQTHSLRDSRLNEWLTSAEGCPWGGKKPIGIFLLLIFFVLRRYFRLSQSHLYSRSAQRGVCPDSQGEEESQRGGVHGVSGRCEG